MADPQRFGHNNFVTPAQFNANQGLVDPAAAPVAPSPWGSGFGLDLVGPGMGVDMPSPLPASPVSPAAPPSRFGLDLDLPGYTPPEGPQALRGGIGYTAPAAPDPRAAYLADGVGADGKVKLGTTSSNSSTRQASSPEIRASRAEEDRLNAEMAARQTELATARKADALDKSEQITSRVADLETRFAEKQQAIAQNAADMEELRGDVTRKSAQYQKAAADLDGRRLLKGREWIGGLAMAFGAYGATLGKTQNFAMQILEDAMDRDFATQKTQLDAKKEDITLARQIYNDHREQFRDDMAARSMAKADMLEIVAAKADARAQKMQGTEAEAQTLQVRDAALERAAEKRTTAYEREAGTRNAATTVSYGYQTGGPAPNPGDKDPHFNDVAKRVGNLLAAMTETDNLKNKNNASNIVTRNFPEVSALFGADSGIAQNTAVTNAKGASIKASSGDAFSQTESAEKQKTLTTGIGSTDLNKSVDENLSSDTRKVAALFATLKPEQKAEMMSRLEANGTPPELLMRLRGAFQYGRAASASGDLGGTVRGRVTE